MAVRGPSPRGWVTDPLPLWWWWGAARDLSDAAILSDPWRWADRATLAGNWWVGRLVDKVAGCKGGIGPVARRWGRRAMGRCRSSWVRVVCWWLFAGQAGGTAVPALLGD